MKWIILCLTLVLFACKDGSGGGSDTGPDPQDPDMVFYPFTPDYITPGGMEVELHGHSPEIIENNADTWYEETQQCVADWYAALYPSLNFEFHDPPPVVIAIDPESICGDFDGFVNGIYCTNFAIPIMVVRGGATYQGSGVWKHEFIHHILFMNDFNQTMSLNHQPDEIWNNCVL